MEIIDKIQVRDSSQEIKGIIRFYDREGNFIYETHNMVVRSGRRLLFRLLLNGLGVYQQNDFTMYYNLSYLNPQVMTTENMSLDGIQPSSTTVLSKQINTTDIVVSGNGASDTGDLKIQINIAVNGTEDFRKYNQLYLTYKEDSTNYLFSRVALDPHYLGDSDVGSMQYSLYF